ncbi:MAG: AAA family ATPase [Burkholderiaceae bacterium]
MPKFTFFYPNGPSERDLNELRQGYRMQREPGLFLNDKEFFTYQTLLRELAEQRAFAKGLAEGTLFDEEPIEHAADDEEEDDSLTTASDDESTDEVTQASDPITSTATVYTVEAIDEAHRLLNEDNRKPDQQHGLVQRFTNMRKRGGERHLVELTDDWQEALNTLEDHYPNFGAVINHIRTESHLASLSKQPVLQLPPILLCGATGIGKTAFVMALAKILRKRFVYYSMENAQTSFSLCGTASHWGNTQTGLIFDALVDHDCINPIFLVDELDKASTDTRYDPIAPLYKLLEAKQAAQFCDESISELPIDASHITWIFTANDLNRIPAPIRNRLQVFDVPAPTIGQGKDIVRRVFEEMALSIRVKARNSSTWLQMLNLELKEDAVFYLAVLSVRQAKIKLRHAMAKALFNKSYSIFARDLTDAIDLNQMTIDKGEAGAH